MNMPEAERLVRLIPSHTEIFQENDRSDGVYIVQTGMVQLYCTIETGGKTVEVELARVGPHGMFGEMALIDHQRRSSNARTLAPTEVVVIEREMFEQHLRTLPPWVLILVRLFVRRIRETNRKLFDVLEVEGGDQLEKHLDHPFIVEGAATADGEDGEELKEATRSLLKELGLDQKSSQS